MSGSKVQLSLVSKYHEPPSRALEARKCSLLSKRPKLSLECGGCSCSSSILREGEVGVAIDGDAIVILEHL